jgi:hypothetical protein
MRGRRQSARPRQYPPDKPRGTRSTDRSAWLSPAAKGTHENKADVKEAEPKLSQSKKDGKDDVRHAHG